MGPAELLDALPDGAIAADAAGRIALANAAAVRLLGRPLAELIGQPLADLFDGDLPPAGPTLRAVSGPDGRAIRLELTVATAAAGGLVVSLRERPGPIEVDRLGAAARDLRATARSAADLGARPDLERVLREAAVAIRDEFTANAARVWLRDEPGQPLQLRSAVGPALNGDQAAIEPPAIVELAGSGRPVVADAPDGRARSVVPLVVDGDLWGVLDLETEGPLPPDDLDALAGLAALVSAAPADVRLLGRERAARAEADCRRFQAIVELIPVGVMVAEGPDGRITLVNPAGRAIWGGQGPTGTLAEYEVAYPIASLAGAPLDATERPLWRALHRGERVRELVRYRLPDGRDRVFDVTATPFPAPGGGALATFADITERLDLEGELAERAAQLKALLDHLPVGVAYFDRLGNLRACNGAARRMLGRPRDELIGEPGHRLFAESPDLAAALGRCVDGRTPQASPNVPWPDPVAPGAVRFLSWRFEPLPGPASKSRGALALVADVTEQKRADDDLQAAKEAAEASARNKARFLSAVSHDLRTPVNGLSLLSELLCRLVAARVGPGDELGELAGDLRGAAANLVELINDLLDLTRFDLGEADHHPSTFALDDWFDSVLRPLEPSAAAKGLTLSWGADRPGRALRADRVKLGRVLTNLVGNAIKFTDAGAVVVSAGADPEGWLVLEVRDTGPGIPADQRERIFDEFAQLRNPERDRTKGTGLGLAICRRLVGSVGGQIAVAEAERGGSVFTARFPPDHLVDAPPPPGPSDSRFGPAPGPGGPILLIEDDPTTRLPLARLLEEAGYAVEPAASGPEALDRLERGPCALVLLDLMMPGMDGLEVLRLIRAASWGADLPVVVLSGDALGERQAQVVALGATDLLAKPVDLDALLDRVARYVPTDPG